MHHKIGSIPISLSVIAVLCGLLSARSSICGGWIVENVDPHTEEQFLEDCMHREWCAARSGRLEELPSTDSLSILSMPVCQCITAKASARAKAMT